MAWTKAKTAIVAGVVVLLAAGTTMVTVKEIQERNANYSWRVRYFDSKVLDQAYPQVAILPAKFLGTGSWGESNGKTMGVGITVKEIIVAAYDESSSRTIVSTDLPSERYDYIASLRGGLDENREALQREIKKKFGLTGRREVSDTDVLLLTVKQPDAPGLKPSAPNKTKFNDSSMLTGNDQITAIDLKLHFLVSYLEGDLQVPVIDKTGLSGNFDFNLKWNNTEGLKKALLDQLGLELVPTNMPVEMLIVEKVK